MAHDVLNPTPEYLAFWRERHVCTLTTPRPDGTPHVVPVGVTYDPEAGLARVISNKNSKKIRNVLAAQATEQGPARVAVCQMQGRRWATLEGSAVVRTDENLGRRGGGALRGALRADAVAQSGPGRPGDHPRPSHGTRLNHPARTGTGTSTSTSTSTSTRKQFGFHLVRFKHWTRTSQRRHRGQVHDGAVVWGKHLERSATTGESLQALRGVAVVISGSKSWWSR